MAICYELTECMTLVSEDAATAEPGGGNIGASETVPLVKVVSSDDFDKIASVPDDGREALRVLSTAPSNFIDVHPDFIVGSFAVPDMNDASNDPCLFSFYLDRTRLVFVDDSSTCADILAGIAHSDIMSTMSTPHCLYMFMKVLIVDDYKYFDQNEDAMESIEESIVVNKRDVDVRRIMRYRRLAMSLGAYYLQIAAMADLLEDNENKLMTHSEAHAFAHIQYFADRFATRAETLKEYSLQLHELHQTSIDLAQNSIMQTFTIVTVLFAPLTLITGWFGMNLSVLPGLEWPYMFLLLIGAAAVCTTLLLLWFHKRRWL